MIQPKEKRKLLALFIILASLSLTYTFLNFLPLSNHKLITTNKLSQKSLQILKLSHENIIKVVISNNKSKKRLTLIPKEGEHSKNNSHIIHWGIAEHPNIPLKESSLRAIISSIESLKEHQLYQQYQESDLKTFGLAPPQVTLTIFTQEKDNPNPLQHKIHEILIGTSNIVKEDYYIKLPNINQIYLVPSRKIKFFLKDFTQLWATDFPSLDLNKGFKLLEFDNHYNQRIVIRPIKSEEEHLLPPLTNYVIEKPYPSLHSVDNYELDRLSKLLTLPISIKKFIEDGEVKDLSPYGLDKNFRVLKIKTISNQLIEIHIGKPADDFSSYATSNIYKGVFTLSNRIVSTLNIGAFTLLSKLIVLYHVKNIKEINFSYLNKDFKLIINKNLTGLLNNKREIDQQNLRELYKQIISLFYEGEITSNYYKPINEKGYLEIKLKNREQHFIEFYPYPIEGFYAISIDKHTPQLLLQKRQLEKLLLVFQTANKTSKVNILE